MNKHTIDVARRRSAVVAVPPAEETALRAEWARWEPAPEPDPVDALFANPAVAALIEAINDGSLPVGQGLAAEELRALVRATLA